MAFNINQAKQAGYSDAEIADYLGKENNFKVTDARNSGYSDVEIIDHLTKNPVQKSSVLSAVKSGLSFIKDAAYDAIDTRTLSEKGLLKPQEENPNEMSRVVEGVPLRADYFDKLKQQDRLAPQNIDAQASQGGATARAADVVIAERPMNAGLNKSLNDALHPAQAPEIPFDERMREKRRLDALAKAKIFTDKLQAANEGGTTETALKQAVEYVPTDDEVRQKADEIAYKEANYLEPNFKNIVHGLAQATPQGIETIKQGVRSQVADLIDNKYMAQDAKIEAQINRDEIEKSTPTFDSKTSQGIYSGATSLIQQIPGLAASLATGNPVLALTAAGLMTEAEAYTRYKARGATPQEALTGALGEGTVEVLTEIAPMGFIVNKFGKVGAGQFIAGLLARDVLPEQAATLAQDAIDTAIANPNKTWGEYASERKDAAYQTLVATVTQAGAIGATNAGVRMFGGKQEDDLTAKKSEKLKSLPNENLDRLLATAQKVMPADVPLIEAEKERRANTPTLQRAAEAGARATANSEAIPATDLLADDILGESNVGNSEQGNTAILDSNTDGGGIADGGGSATPAIYENAAAELSAADITRETPTTDDIESNLFVGADAGTPTLHPALENIHNTNDVTAHEAATSPLNDIAEPTPAQKNAGNYRVGKVKVAGLDISVENPHGSTRSGTDRDGKDWSRDMNGHYGYIKAPARAPDKEHVDVNVKPGTAEDYAGDVFVVNQNHPDTGKFDEPKIYLGYQSKEEAEAAYRSNYADDWQGLDNISQVPMDKFKTMLNDKKAFLKPINEDKVSQAIPVAPKTTKVATTNPLFEKNKAVVESLVPRMAWGTIGNKRIDDAEGNQIGRSKFVPIDDAMDEIRIDSGLSYNAMQNAVNKALKSEVLSKQEHRAIDLIANYAENNRDALTVKPITNEQAANVQALRDAEPIGSFDELFYGEDTDEAKVAVTELSDADLIEGIGKEVSLDEFEAWLNAEGVNNEQKTDNERAETQAESNDSGRSAIDNSKNQTRDNQQQSTPVQQTQNEPVKELVTAIVKRRAAATQIGKIKQFNAALDVAKRFMNGETVKPSSFKLAASTFKADPPLSSAFTALHKLANAPAKEARAEKTNTIEAYKQRIADAKTIDALQTIAGEIQRDSALSDKQATNLDDAVFEAQDALESTGPDNAQNQAKNTQEPSNDKASSLDQTLSQPNTEETPEAAPVKADVKSVETVEDKAAQLKAKYSKEIKKNLGVKVGVESGKITYISASFENKDDARKYGGILSNDFNEQLSISKFSNGQYEAFINLSEKNDLLGDNTAAKQAVADAERAKDAKRNEVESYAEKYQRALAEKQDAIARMEEEGARLKVTPSYDVIVYHGTSEQNEKSIRKNGFNKFSYFSVNKSGTQYGDSPLDVAKRKFKKDAVVMEIKVDPRFLTTAAAGSELYSEFELKNDNGVFTNDSEADKAAASGAQILFSRSNESAIIDGSNKEVNDETTKGLRSLENAARKDIDDRISISESLPINQLARAGGGRSEGQARAFELAGKLANIFESKIITFDNNTPEIFDFNGVQYGNTIYLNAKTNRPAHVVFGHEFLHELRKNDKAAYGKLMQVIEPMITDIEGFRSAEGIEKFRTLDYVKEELAANLVGNRFNEVSFWRKLALKMPKQFKAIVDVMADLIGKIQSHFDGNKKLAGDEFITDIAKAREAIVDAVAMYKKLSGNKNYKPKFTRTDRTPSKESGNTFLTAALEYLSREPEFFQNARTESKSMEDIASAIDIGYTVKPLGASQTKLKNATKAWDVTVPNTVYRSGVIYEKDNDVWIDVSRLISGNDKGSKIYSIAADYAHNNGKVLIGDPEGLSKKAYYRRNENMLSSALKHGTTKHLMPHLAQEIPAEYYQGGEAAFGKEVRALNWIEGDDINNIKELIYNSYQGTIKNVPEIKNVTYNPESRQFEYDDGRTFTNQDSERISTRIANEPNNPYRAGSSTLKRAALFNTFLRKSSEGRGRELLGALVTELQRNGLSNNLKGVMYSRANPQQATLQTKFDAPELKSDLIENETRIQATQRLMQDDVAIFKRIQEKLIANGGKVTDRENVYEAIMRYPSRFRNKIKNFERETLVPLIDRIAKLDTDFNEIGRYMLALHAKEGNIYIQSINDDPAAGVGMTNEEAANVIATIRARADFTEFDSVAKKLQEITSKRLDMLVTANIYTQEQANAMRSTYKFYVPTKGFANIDIDDLPAQYSGSGYSTSKNLDKRRKGRKSEPSQIIENIIHDYQMATIAIEKSIIGKYLRNLIAANPNDKLWTLQEATTEKVIEKDKNIWAVVSKGVAVERFATKREADTKSALINKGSNNHAQVVKMEGKELVVDRVMPFDKEQEIRFIENGKEYRIQLKDPLMVNAYNKLNVVRTNNMVARGVNNVLSFLREMWTQKSPVFIVVNALLRDPQSAIAAGLPLRGATWTKNMIGNYTSSAKALYQFESGVEVTNERMRKHLENYRKNGGGIGYAFVGDIEQINREIENLVRVAKGKSNIADKLYDNAVIKTIEKINAVGENAIRFASYVADIESGRSQLEAISISKEITVNFNRKGELSSALGMVYMFANSNIQGINNILVQPIKKNKKAAAAVFGGLVAIGFALGMIEAALDASDGDDDDEDLFNENSRQMSLKIGDTKYSLDNAYVLGWFLFLGKMLARSSLRPETIGDNSLRIASSFFEHFSFFGNPIPNIDNIDAKNAFIGIIPTLATPIISPLLNRNRFGRDMMPNFDNGVAPDAYRAWKGTKNSAYSKITGFLNEQTGGNLVESGMIDVSPETLKSLISFVFGGVGTFLGSSGSVVADALDGEINSAHIPFVNRFYNKADSSDYQIRFYNKAGKARDFKNKIDDLRSAEMFDRADYLEEKNQGLYLAGKVASRDWKIINELRKEELGIKMDSSLSKSERKLKLKEIENEKINIMRDFHVYIKEQKVSP